MTTQQYLPQAQVSDIVIISAAHACGWFESSYELSSGTQVTDGLSLEEFELWVQVSSRQLAAKTTGKALALS